MVIWQRGLFAVNGIHRDDYIKREQELLNLVNPVAEYIGNKYKHDVWLVINTEGWKVYGELK